MNFLAPEMIVNCVPRANVDLDELVDSGHRAMALYNKMIGRVFIGDQPGAADLYCPERAIANSIVYC